MRPLAWKPIVLALALLALGGCAQYGVASTAVKVGGAKVADTAAAEAEWTLCNAITVGAARRRYGVSQDRADAYNALCETSGRIVQPDAE